MGQVTSHSEIAEEDLSLAAAGCGTLFVRDDALWAASDDADGDSADISKAYGGGKKIGVGFAYIEWADNIPMNVSQGNFPLKKMADTIAEMSDELKAVERQRQGSTRTASLRHNQRLNWGR